MKGTIMLLVESEEFKCSKQILAESSQYFNVMFNGSFVERESNVIKLEGVTKKSITYILDNVNNPRKGWINDIKSTRELIDLLEAVTMLQFHEMQVECKKVLLASINCSNAIDVLETASKLDLFDLLQRARAMALWNFTEISELDSFCKLNIDQVEGYLSDTALHSSDGEWGVWNAIDRWLSQADNDNELKFQHLTRLIKCLRVKILNLTDLQAISLCPLIQSHPPVEDAFKSVISQRRRKRSSDERNDSNAGDNAEDSENSLSIQSMKYQGESTESIHPATISILESWEVVEPRRLPLAPCVVGSVVTTASPCVVRFDITEKRLTPQLWLDKLENSLGSMVGFKVFTQGSKLYLLGGEMMTKQSSWNLPVWEYDQISYRWSFLCNLRKPSRHMMACCIAQDLYIMGGFGKHRVIQDSVEVYSITEGRWKAGARLPRPMYSTPCCVFRGQIYVFESFVYQYSPDRDVWVTLQVKLPPGKGFSSAMTNKEFIYLTAAFGKTVYKFDPSASESSLEQVGDFKNDSTQTCLVDDFVYSLSQDEFGDELYCEKMDLRTGRSEELWCGTSQEVHSLDAKHRHGCFPMLIY